MVVTIQRGGRLINNSPFITINSNNTERNKLDHTKHPTKSLHYRDDQPMTVIDIVRNGYNFSKL